MSTGKGMNYEGTAKGDENLAFSTGTGLLIDNSA